MIKPKVFISYSSEDRSIAEQIINALGEKDIGCWISHQTISSGEHWSGSIMSAIQETPVFLFILSKNSNSQPKQVLREITEADNTNRHMICFQIEPLSIHPALQYFYNSIHRLEAFKDPFEFAVNKLIQDIKKAIRSKKQVVLLQARNVLAEKIRVAFDRNDYDTARKLAIKLADEDEQAQYYLGLMALEGLGQDVDYQEAESWLIKSSSQNQRDAQFELARMYLHNKTTNVQPQLAFKYALQAVESGKTETQLLLGEFYLDERATQKSLSGTLFWWRKAASQSCADAYYMIGRLKCRNMFAGSKFYDFFDFWDISFPSPSLLFSYSYFQKASLLGHKKSSLIILIFKYCLETYFGILFFAWMGVFWLYDKYEFLSTDLLYKIATIISVSLTLLFFIFTNPDILLFFVLQILSIKMSYNDLNKIEAEWS